MHLEQKDWLLVGLCMIFFAGFSSVVWTIGAAVFPLLLSLALGIVMIGQIEGYRRSQLQHRQVQSLFSLFSLLKINAPLPSMAGYAIPPDCAVAIVSLIFDRQPQCILELGSGTSTLIASYALKAIGGGTVVSLEQKGEFAVQSSDGILRHRLQGIATVIHAPLKKISLSAGEWSWYDTTALKQIKNIDMVIVDGPTREGSQKLARYPALPVLYPLLSEEAVILVDDAFRSDVKRMVTLWLSEFKDFTCELLDTQQGTVILRRQRLLHRTAGQTRPELTETEA